MTISENSREINVDFDMMWSFPRSTWKWSWRRGNRLGQLHRGARGSLGTPENDDVFEPNMELLVCVKSRDDTVEIARLESWWVFVSALLNSFC